jgi:hypothetical protein
MSFWRSFYSNIKHARRSPFFRYFLFFVLFQMVYEQHGSTNVASRLAQLASMSQRYSFDIAPYKDDWTVDWAETPDGGTYSNKAPGPAFIAFPLYWIFDRVTVDVSQNELENRTRRNNLGHHFFRLATLVFQILPFALIGLYFLGRLTQSGVANETLRWWTLAYLFGTTASVFLNTYFGHGIAAVGVLFLAIALLERSWCWAGFFFGWALLSDYALAMVLPTLVVYLCFASLRRRDWIAFFVGGTLPGVLWIWYHSTCFGSPLALPNKFQNPAFVDLAHSSTALWGVISFFPDWNIVVKLLVGSERGLLFSQPWILMVLLVFFWGGFRRLKPIFPKTLLYWIVVSFFAVFAMNASFGGWHGGASAGPRYLAVVLPLMTLLIPSLWDDFSAPLRKVLRVTILYSCILFGLILSAGVNTPVSGSLLGDLLNKITSPTSHTAMLRFAIFCVAFGGTFWRDLTSHSGHAHKL